MLNVITQRPELNEKDCTVYQSIDYSTTAALQGESWRHEPAWRLILIPIMFYARLASKKLSIKFQTSFTAGNCLNEIPISDHKR